MLPEITIPSLPFIGAYGLTVKSLSGLQSILSGADLTMRRAGEALVVPFPPELGTGAWLFSETAS